MSSPKLFFLHNPKAGGSSLRSLLGDLAGSGKIAPVMDEGPNQYSERRYPGGAPKGFDVYFGHCGYEIYQNVRDGHAVVTNFRDPIQRIYSIYRYWRFNVSSDIVCGLHPADAEVVRLAKVLPFNRFIRSDNPDLDLYISNFHFRQIYKSGWMRTKDSLWAKWVVMRRIQKMPWFYIAETPQASATLLRNLFPKGPELRFPVENRSCGTAEPVSEADAKHIIGMNLLDYHIYGYALKLQATRLARANA